MAESESETPPPTKSKTKWYQEMIGPLPAVAWVAVVGVGLIYSIYRKKHPTAKATPAAATTDMSAPIDTVGTVGNLGSTAVGNTSAMGMTDNTQWYRKAMSDLVGRGYDPTLTDQALRDYVEGNALNAAENAIVQEAIVLEGPLPNPPPPAAIGNATGAPPPIPNPGGTAGNPGTVHGANPSGVQTKLNHLRDVMILLGNTDGAGNKISDYWPVSPVNGNLSDPMTVAAVKAFQLNFNFAADRNGDAKLPVNGILDSKTNAFMDQLMTYFKLG